MKRDDVCAGSEGFSYEVVGGMKWGFWAHWRPWFTFSMMPCTRILPLSLDPARADMEKDASSLWPRSLPSAQITIKTAYAGVVLICAENPLQW
jgi:hypothetical protein